MPKAKNYEQGYKKYTSKAKEYFQNKKKSENLLNEAVNKANQKKGRLEEVWEKLQLLLEMFRSWIKGEYKEIPKGSIIMIIATILYFVSPIDLIPDFIVGLGFFDDAAVIGFAIKQISEDIDRYINWKNSKKFIEQDTEE
ncbi:YkvA family protein [Gracilibacillus massiliensis]|uniref:YkvA family protein n=1 Tax=Gracilibacillus massiliensis TaxID=1564956 RepID=UPI00071C6D7C|nr:YkvA family protein [Gracilibacillus massiliensis]